MRSGLYTGTLMHARREPVDNVFRYPVSFAMLDLDELAELDRRLRLFSVNRPTRSRSTTGTTSTTTACR